MSEKGIYQPVQAREALRRIFEGGRILLTPGDDGVYIAEATFLPLVALAETTKTSAAGRGLGHGTAISCARPIRLLEHAVFKALSLRMVA